MSYRQSVIEPGFYRLESSELISTHIVKIRWRHCSNNRSEDRFMLMPRSVMRKGQLIEVCGVDKNSELLVKCYSSYTVVSDSFILDEPWSTKGCNGAPCFDTVYRETRLLLDEKEERQLSFIISKGDRERELDATYDIRTEGMRSADTKRWLADPGRNNKSRKLLLGLALASIHALMFVLELLLLLLILGQLNVTGDIAGIIEEVSVVVWNGMISIPEGKSIIIAVAAVIAYVILERMLKRAFERAFYSDINEVTFLAGDNLKYKYHWTGITNPDDKIMKYIGETCTEERCYDTNYVFMYTMRV